MRVSYSPENGKRYSALHWAWGTKPYLQQALHTERTCNGTKTRPADPECTGPQQLRPVAKFQQLRQWMLSRKQNEQPPLELIENGWNRYSWWVSVSTPASGCSNWLKVRGNMLFRLFLWKLRSRLCRIFCLTDTSPGNRVSLWWTWSVMRHPWWWGRCGFCGICQYCILSTTNWEELHAFYLDASGLWIMSGTRLHGFLRHRVFVSYKVFFCVFLRIPPVI